MKPRLGVNIDHVATVRQARGEKYPSLVEAAKVSLKAGADQITIHLREDRRHIQDTDVEAVQLVTKEFKRPLNFEMGCAREIIDIAIATAPDWICLVPEKREERTTEGGLNLLDDQIRRRVEDTCVRLKESLPGVKISLFLESNQEIISKAIELKPEAVEIHTGDFACAYLNGDAYSHFLDEFKNVVRMLKEKSIAPHAGHGLTDESVKPLLELKLFEEYNIGHWIVSQAIFEGLGSVVKRLNNQFQAGGL